MHRTNINLDNAEFLNENIKGILRKIMAGSKSFQLSYYSPIYTNGSPLYFGLQGSPFGVKIEKDCVKIKQKNSDELLSYGLYETTEITKAICDYYDLNLFSNDKVNARDVVLKIINRFKSHKLELETSENGKIFDVYCDFYSKRVKVFYFEDERDGLILNYLNTRSIRNRRYSRSVTNCYEDPLSAFKKCEQTLICLDTYYLFVKNCQYFRKLYQFLKENSDDYELASYPNRIAFSFTYKNFKGSFRVNPRTLESELFDTIKLETVFTHLFRERDVNDIINFLKKHYKISNSTISEEDAKTIEESIFVKPKVKYYVDDLSKLAKKEEEKSEIKEEPVVEIVKEEKQVQEETKVEQESIEEEKVEVEPEKVVVNNIDNFEYACIDWEDAFDNGENPNLDTISELYDKLSDEEIKDEGVTKLYSEVLQKHYSKQDETNDVVYTKRNIFVSTRIKDKLPENDKYFDEILLKMQTLDLKDLRQYFVTHKRLNFPYGFSKIRINNNKKDRLVFVSGKKFGKSANDIYLYDYITDHNFTYLKDVKLDENLFELRMSVAFINLSEKQLSLAESYRTIPYTPLICLGCAGSGKTLISVEMYNKIANDLLSGEVKDFTKRDLIYLTYNDACLNSAATLIRAKCNIVNAFSIKDFFLNFLSENNVQIDKKKFVNEKHFFSWWNDRNSLSFIRDHTRRLDLNTYKNSTSARYAYTFFRGYFKGINITKNSKQYITYDEFVSHLKSKQEPLSKNEKDTKNLYDLFLYYQVYIEDNNCFDDNDLARKVISLINEKPILAKYERIIIDEVQDLTEIQLEAIIKCSKDKLRMYFFGDQNQSINPTLFDVNTIQRIFKENDSNYNVKPEKLNISYRFGPLLADYMNNLKRLIDKYIGCSGAIEELSCLETETSKWGLKTSNEKVSNEFLERVKNVANQKIIVPDESVKNELIKKFGEEISESIITIYDSKGLEWDSVILYNMIGYNQNVYKEIFNNEAKYSTLHRMVFNQYYVGVTRAKQSFVIIDDKLNDDIKTKLLEPLVLVDENNVSTYTSDSSSDKDWLEEAKRMFALDQYSLAFSAFKRVKEKTEETNRYLVISELLKNGDFTLENADLCKQYGFYNQAMYIYKELDEINLVNLIKLYLKERIPASDIEKIIKEENLSKEDIDIICESTYIKEKDTNIKNKITNILNILKE